MVERVCRGNGDTVRSRRLVRPVAFLARRLDVRARVIPVKRLELGEVHPLDVTANTSLAEAERHPRLEVGDNARLHLGMVMQVEIQAVRPGVHERLQPVGARRVRRLQTVGINELLHAQIPIDLAFPLRFGEAAHRIDEVRLDAIEIVLRLRVHQPEHRIGVGLAVNVGDAPGVARDRDVPRLALPPNEIWIRRLSRRGGDDGRGKNEREILHSCTDVGGSC